MKGKIYWWTAENSKLHNKSVFCPIFGILPWKLSLWCDKWFSWVLIPYDSTFHRSNFETLSWWCLPITYNSFQPLVPSLIYLFFNAMPLNHISLLCFYSSSQLMLYQPVSPIFPILPLHWHFHIQASSMYLHISLKSSHFCKPPSLIINHSQS